MPRETGISFGRNSPPRPELPLSSLPPALPPPDLGAFIDALVTGLPEFAPRYLDLVAGCDDDPGGPLVLMGLADFVAERLVALESERSVLERALRLVEHLIEGSDDPEGASELVGLAFFDCFSPDDRRRLVPWLGSCSTLALENLGPALRRIASDPTTS